MFFFFFKYLNCLKTLKEELIRVKLLLDQSQYMRKKDLEKIRKLQKKLSITEVNVK